MLASEFLSKSSQPCWMIYSVANAERAVYAEELRQRCDEREEWHFIQHLSDDEGFIDADYLRQQVGALSERTYYICGPQIMMDSITDLLLEADVPLQQIITEDFDIR